MGGPRWIFLFGVSQIVSGFTEWMLDWFNSAPWIGLLLLMMVLDVVSGIITAIVEKRLSSKVGYKGMMRKAATLLVIGAAAVIDHGVTATLPEDIRGTVGIPFAKLTAGFFLINETLSVLENAKRAGVPLPSFLTKSLIDTISRFTAPPQENLHLEIKQGVVDARLVHKPVADVAEPPPQTK